jgi:hypothetical protein
MHWSVDPGACVSEHLPALGKLVATKNTARKVSHNVYGQTCFLAPAPLYFPSGHAALPT